MIRRIAVVIGLLLFLLIGVGRAQQGTTGRAADTKLTPMQRADALLKQMTVEEKAMQLSSVFPLALFNTEGPNRSQENCRSLCRGTWGRCPSTTPRNGAAATGAPRRTRAS